MASDSEILVDVVFGSRREAMHLAPVVHAMRENNLAHVRTISMHTGDTDLAPALSSLSLTPDVQWRIRGTDHSSGTFCGEIMLLMGELWNWRKPQWMLTFGQSDFSFACAFSAFHNHVPLAHVHDVEIDEPHPHNQQLQKSLNAMVDLHFAASSGVRERLIREGVNDRKIYSVGSPIADSAHLIRDNLRSPDLARDFFLDLPEAIFKKLNQRKFVLLDLKNFPDSLAPWGEFSKRFTAQVPDHLLVVLGAPEALTQTRLPIEEHCAIVYLSNVGHFQRCYLVAMAGCALSDSIETLDECVSNGTPGILIARSTERLDLVASGWMTLAKNSQVDLLNQLLYFLRENQRGSGATVAINALSPLCGASQRIAAALTSRKDENARTEKTSLPSRRAI
ncbi:hypothetical protein EBU99_07525 [bacterium]|nr:hypothetical protein [bacterium]